MAAHAIVALWGGLLNELLGHINYVDFKIIAGFQVLHQVAPARNYHAVACLEAKLFIITLKGAIAPVAVGMAQVTGTLGIANALQ